MRKLLWLIVCLMTMAFTSCSKTYLTSAEYEVCYPDGTQKFNESVTISSTSEPYVKCYSVGGTNYVAVISNEYNLGKTPKIFLNSSTAPIRLKTYDVKRLKGGKKKTYDGNDGVY